MDLNSLFTLSSSKFQELALEVFAFQYEQVPVYQKYCKLMHKHPKQVQAITDIPFLPIDLFKSFEVLAKEKTAATVFESSTTTSSTPSRHFIADLDLYEMAFSKHFEASYGNPEEYLFLALLPSYLQRGHSSLVYMVNNFINISKYKESGFFVDDFGRLHSILKNTTIPKKQIILLGVTYALLDFAAYFPLDLNGVIIMETGGMKGKRAEMTKMEVYDFLKHQFHVDAIHSEYGMTELLSQAYSKADGIYSPPAWMRILVRDIYDPTTYVNKQSGALNIIDLANLYSCSFIATSDVGRVNANGTFEILGRLNEADVRGCNLMYDGIHSNLM